jgi:hypothetical protein
LIEEGEIVVHDQGFNAMISTRVYT